jgi:hypothetical protein
MASTTPFSPNPVHSEKTSILLTTPCHGTINAGSCGDRECTQVGFLQLGVHGRADARLGYILFHSVPFAFILRLPELEESSGKNLYVWCENKILCMLYIVAHRCYIRNTCVTSVRCSQKTQMHKSIYSQPRASVCKWPGGPGPGPENCWRPFKMMHTCQHVLKAS